MVKKYKGKGILFYVAFSGAFIALFSADSTAVTHIVQFGGSLGNAFSPKTFTAHVGDTVEWEGNFSFHDLQSTTIPSLAAPWHPTLSGNSVFKYAITAPGTYDYQCNIHVSMGMVGSFTVTPTTVLLHSNSAAMQSDFQTITLQGKNTVAFSLSQPAKVTLTVYTVLGKEIASKVNGFISAGPHEVALGPLAKGVYFVKLTEGAASEVKMLHILQ